jgi:hypothetical protein
MAERLLVQFERQAEHRMTLETRVISGDVRRANWGLVAGFAFGVIVLIAFVVLILNGHDGAGTTGIIVEFVTFAGALLYSGETRRRERNKRAGN